ncbi:MAG: sulfatase, partial [Solirubrobacteraceae bacterium]
MRRGIGPALTIVAVLVVWAALVVPDQPSDLSLSGFLRLPLEGLVLAAAASVLPVILRRSLAGVAGPLLALVVIFKVLDIGFLDTFDRRFDLLSDSSYAGTGIETLRASIGRTDTNLVVIGVVVAVIVLVTLTTLSAFRLTRIAAANRRWTLRVVATVGAVWALCWVLGAQFVAHTPIASTVSAGVVVNEVRTVAVDIHDQTVFANQIKHDTFRNTPARQLLTGLRGKDVLLVFVESYGQVAVQDSSFSSKVDAVLETGTKRLRAAG